MMTLDISIVEGSNGRLYDTGRGLWVAGKTAVWDIVLDRIVPQL